MEIPLVPGEFWTGLRNFFDFNEIFGFARLGLLCYNIDYIWETLKNFQKHSFSRCPVSEVLFSSKR